MGRCCKSTFPLLLLVFAPSCISKVLRGTPSSWLELEEKPLCVLPPSGNFSGPVQVFVHQDNTRHLEFGDAWSGTQTSVACSGPLPSSCLAHFSEDAKSPSCDVVECPCNRDAANVDTDYLAKMVEVVLPMCRAAAADRGFRILNIGLGGGDIPAYLLSHCPEGTRVESVEFDPRVVAVAGKFFGTSDVHGRHRVYTGDGGAQAAALLREGQRYDAVLVDVFDDAGDVPASCAGDSFVQSVHGLLRPSGKLVQQVWDRQHNALLGSFKRRFGNGAGGSVLDGDGTHGQWVLVATKGPSA